jgi:class 3 adenylate cyclase
VAQRLLAAVEDMIEAEPVGELALKGFQRAITAYNVVRLRESS